MEARNTIQLIGNLGTQPKKIIGANGQMMVFFPMATHDSYINTKGAKTTVTEWHNIVAFGKLARRIDAALGKGDEILIKGKLTYNNFGLDVGKKGVVFIKEVLFMKTSTHSKKLDHKSLEIQNENESVVNVA